MSLIAKDYIFRATRALLALGVTGLFASTKAALPERVLVAPKSAQASVQLEKEHKAKKRKIKKKLKEAGGLHVIELQKGEKAAQVAAEYQASGLAEFAEPDYPIRASSLPNDPALAAGALWGLQNPYNGGDIDAPQAWEFARNAFNVVVAVIDSGIRYTHEDLQANMWVNSRERVDGLDNDANGIVDDIHGIDAIYNDGLPWDDNGHGTHVAGTIGAVGNNGVGVVGVCWNVRLMALKFMDADGGGHTSDAVQCIDYAIRNGAKVINASWGSGAYSYTLERAIARARNAGVIFVTAAGNDAANNDLLPSYPSSYKLDNVVSVTATSRDDTLDAAYANYGAATVTMAAPGSWIYSTWNGSDDSYEYSSGTSMASPHVAGALALLKATFPAESHVSLINRLVAASDKVPGLIGKTTTGGRLNLAALFSPKWNLELPHEEGGNVQRLDNESLYTGSTTVLRADPAPGYSFEGWTGSITSTLNPVEITVTTNMSIHAVFRPAVQQNEPPVEDSLLPDIIITPVPEEPAEEPPHTEEPSAGEDDPLPPTTIEPGPAIEEPVTKLPPAAGSPTIQIAVSAEGDYAHIFVGVYDAALEFSSDLNTWTAVAEPLVQDGDRWRAIAPLRGGAGYFRVRRTD
ncbi:MAG TPA: S8 family serine peptidase [Methylomirabilota bacterium]|nr:S8 family serine peptidase [Methylomirabilota bacterium]